MITEIGGDGDALSDGIEVASHRLKRRKISELGCCVDRPAVSVIRRTIQVSYGSVPVTCVCFAEQIIPASAHCEIRDLLRIGCEDGAPDRISGIETKDTRKGRREEPGTGGGVGGNEQIARRSERETRVCCPPV